VRSPSAAAARATGAQPHRADSVTDERREQLSKRLAGVLAEDAAQHTQAPLGRDARRERLDTDAAQRELRQRVEHDAADAAANLLCEDPIGAVKRIGGVETAELLESANEALRADLRPTVTLDFAFWSEWIGRVLADPDADLKRSLREQIERAIGERANDD
jgi:hypothetical protein